MTHPPSTFAPIRRSPLRRGFTLIEVVIAAAVLFIGLLAMTSTSWVVHSLRGTNADKQTAHQALQGVVEDLYAQSELAREDPNGWGQALFDLVGAGQPGETFAVQGLQPWPNEAAVGTVTLVVDETLTDAELGVQLGMPRDLNADGAVNDTDVTSDAVLLPVIIELRWHGEAGDRRLRQCIYLLAY